VTAQSVFDQVVHTCYQHDRPALPFDWRTTESEHV
jgi:hypothetical protein